MTPFSIRDVFKVSTGIALAALLLSPAVLLAQATSLVDPLDPSYRDLQLLVDAGVIHHFSLGQRPLSRAAFARALQEADGHLWAPPEGAASGRISKTAAASPDGQSSFLRDLVATIRERLRLPDSGGASTQLKSYAPLRAVTLDLTQTNEPTRPVPENNGLGEIDASLNTLLALRQGRPLVAGSNAFFESLHSLETRNFALSATPQLLFVRTASGTQHSDLRLQELQLRFVYRNAALDIGREYLVWGRGRDVGLLNSDNSPPLNMIKVSGEQPFTLPWVFRRLGATQVSLFYADLGADQNFPHAYAVGYRVNIAPSALLELGASVYTKSGGRGAPPATMTARLIDLLPFLDASAYNNVFGTRGDFQFSDHYAGFDGRLRLPAVASSFYWELLLNDFDVRRLESVFWEDAGHVFGVDLPPFSPSGRLRGSLEYHHTGIRYYEHQQFISGQTVHRILTGDPLGPDAQGAYADLDWYASSRRRLGLQLAFERRSNDQYIYLPEPNFGFRRIESRPKEWRGRAMLSWQLLPERRQAGGLAQLGYERTRNFDFIHANDRNGFLARVALQYRFE